MGMPDLPHSWCNFVSQEGHIGDTIHTADFWEWAIMLYVKWDGAHVYFFRRTAPNRFDCFGGFVEGLEKTEELLKGYGVDIPAMAAQIKASGVMARHDVPMQYDDLQGMIIGGVWGPQWDRLYQFYEDAYAKHDQHAT